MLLPCPGSSTSGGARPCCLRRGYDGHERVCGLSSKFASVGAEILPYSIGNVGSQEFSGSGPKFQAVLQADGSSTMKPTAGCFEPYEDMHTTELRTLLLSLGYLQDSGGPLRPAVACFYHTNEIGSLVIWPAWCAVKSATELISEQQGRLWKRDPGNLIFVEPSVNIAAKSISTKSEEPRYIW